MKRLVLLLALLTPFIGCVPVQRVVWSADGTRALVIADDGLHLVSPAGALGPLVIGDVRCTAWLNADEIVCVRDAPCPDWTTAAALLGPSAAAAIINAGDRLAVIAAGPPEMIDQRIDSEFDHERELSFDDVDLVALYLHDVRPDAWARLMARESSKQNPAKLPRIVSVECRSVAVDAPARELWRGMHRVVEIRPSPDGGQVALVIGGGIWGDSYRLAVVAATGGPLRDVDPHCARWPDWTTDGSALVYARGDDLADAHATAPRLHLGTVSRWTLADGVRHDLAGLLIHEECRVRCLRDGRILFTSTQVTLPSTSQQLSGEVGLFVLDPDRSAVERIAAQASVSQAIASHLFEPSPDGTRVAIADVDGAVTVLSLATGAVDLVQSRNEPNPLSSSEHANDQIRLRSVPCWRGDDELCYVVPPEKSGGRASLVLRRLADGSERRLDESWPAEATHGFLDDR